ncbi:hypothetical protein BaRGS_00004492 [Batillaria attramentaria]|uniref:Uncharacterized protein n=1 Tax=Batillaria attramentaria TaxID=370345 RepID=A0ABD0LXN7_9CAEN
MSVRDCGNKQICVRILGLYWTKFHLYEFPMVRKAGDTRTNGRRKLAHDQSRLITPPPSPDAFAAPNTHPPHLPPTPSLLQTPTFPRRLRCSKHPPSFDAFAAPNTHPPHLPPTPSLLQTPTLPTFPRRLRCSKHPPSTSASVLTLLSVSKIARHEVSSLYQQNWQKMYS